MRTTYEYIYVPGIIRLPPTILPSSEDEVESIRSHENFKIQRNKKEEATSKI